MHKSPVDDYRKTFKNNFFCDPLRSSGFIHSLNWYSCWGWRSHFKVAAGSFLSWDRISGGHSFRIRYILSEDQISIPVHFKFFRVYVGCCFYTLERVKPEYQSISKGSKRSLWRGPINQTKMTKSQLFYYTGIKLTIPLMCIILLLSSPTCRCV